MTYAYHFDAGERQAFADRQRGIRRMPPADMTHPDTRAFWDGYRPRSSTWAGRSAAAPASWWNETEKEPA